MSKHAQSCPTLCDIMDCSPPGSSVQGDIGVDYHTLLQGIFPTQGSNPWLLPLLNWLVGFSPLSPPGNPHKDIHMSPKSQESLVDTHRNASNILCVPKSHEWAPGLHIAFILLQNGNKCWITNVLKNNSWEWLLHKNISTQSFADGSTYHKKGAEELK